MARSLQCLILFTIMVNLVLCRARNVETHNMEILRSPYVLDKNSLDKTIPNRALPVRENPYAATSAHKINHKETDVPQITEKCKKTNLCLEDEVNNYPEKLAEEFILRGNVSLTIDHIPPQIEQRLNPGNTDQVIPICPARRQLYFPKILKDKKGVHQWVLNPKSQPVQGFVIEMCELDETTNQPKSHNPLVNLTFQNGYKSTGCQQRYINRMVALIKGDKLIWKPMPLPGWCSLDITTDKKDQL